MNLDARLRAHLAAEAARMHVGTGDLQTVMATGGIRRRVAIGLATAGIAAAAIVPLVVAGGDDGGPVAGGDPTTTTEPGTTSEPTTTTEESTTTQPRESTTTAAPEPQSSLIVATAEGIVEVADGEVIDRLDIGPVMIALDDLMGGHVVQIGESAGSIAWRPAGEESFREIVVEAADTRLTLHEVVEIDGTPSVVYTARTLGAEPEASSENLHVVDLASGEDRFVAQVGGYESGPTRVSYATGRFLVSMTAEGYTWFEAVDGSFEHNPRTENDSADDFLVWVGHGVQAPDGETLVYLRGSPRSEAPFELVVFDLVTGEELRSVPVYGARHDTVTRVDWDGTTAVVSLRDTPGAVIHPDRSEGLPVPGIADLVSRGE